VEKAKLASTQLETNLPGNKAGGKRTPDSKPGASKLWCGNCNRFLAGTEIDSKADGIFCKTHSSRVALVPICKQDNAHGLYDRPNNVSKCSVCGRVLERFGETVQNKLDLLGAGTATEMARNTAYVWLNQKRYLKYHKQAGFHEVLTRFDKVIFVPGKGQPIADIFGLKIGLEICFDHASGALKETGPKACSDKPTFHVILSAKVKFKDANQYVRDNGWIVHASSDLSFNSVLQKGKNAPETPKSFGNVDVYDLGEVQFDV
jgi:hypothetical protein